MKCGYCGSTSHNKRTCSGNTKSQKYMQAQYVKEAAKQRHANSNVVGSTSKLPQKTTNHGISFISELTTEHIKGLQPSPIKSICKSEKYRSNWDCSFSNLPAKFLRMPTVPSHCVVNIGNPKDIWLEPLSSKLDRLMLARSNFRGQIFLRLCQLAGHVS